MIIGKFIRDSHVDMFWGEVSFIDCVNVRLLPALKPQAGKPDYYLVGEGLYGALEFGAGWKRENAESGEIYLVVVLDNPSWPARITARLDADHTDDNTFSLSWRRASAAAPAR